MKQRTVPALMYLLTAIALAGFFDALYGAGPVTGRLEAIHAAIVGTVLIALASPLSLFSLRAGGVCGLIASLLLWPYFGPGLLAFPWSRMFEVLTYAMWADTLAALVMLIIATIYSLAQVQLWIRSTRPRGAASPDS